MAALWTTHRLPICRKPLFHVARLNIKRSILCRQGKNCDGWPPLGLPCRCDNVILHAIEERKMTTGQLAPFAWWKSWLDAALSFLYPEVCQVCNQEPATPGNGFVGTNCRKNVKFIAPPLCERCGLAFQGDITTAFVCSTCREEDYAFA